MTITFYSNESDNRVVNKTITELFKQTGTLRSSCSILDPVILIEKSDLNLSTSNYLYIDEFKRYYYITNITSVSKNLWSISAHVDVLMTYKDDLLQLNALVAKQETKANLYLSNSVVPLLPQTMIETIPITGLVFRTNDVQDPETAVDNSNTTIVLATVGSKPTINTTLAEQQFPASEK